MRNHSDQARGEFDLLNLEERLMYDPHATPELISNALDDLAEINFKVLSGSVGLMSRIHSLLSTGDQYTPHKGQGILEDYETLKVDFATMLEHVRFMDGGDNYLQIEVSEKLFAVVDTALTPHLRELDRLFRIGDHTQSPIKGEEMTNVLDSIDRLPSKFREYIPIVSEFLGGGALDDEGGMKLSVEGAVRNLHNVAFGAARSIIHKINYRKDQFQNIELIRLPTHFEYETSYVFNTHRPSIWGLVDMPVETYQESPIWQVVKGIELGMQRDDKKRPFNIMSVLLTKQSLSAFFCLDYLMADKANGSLHALHDPCKEQFDINFYCGNEGNFSRGFTEKVRSACETGGITYGDANWEGKAFGMHTRTERGMERTEFIVRTIADSLVNQYE